jgi:hypothetical protein
MVLTRLSVLDGCRSWRGCVDRHTPEVLVFRYAFV